MCKQLIVIKEETAEKFQKSFNSKLRELEDQNPTFEFNHKEGYCAYIIYSDNDTIMGSVEPKTRYLCDSCLKCLEEPRPHVKWRKCAVHNGAIHAMTECEHYLEVLS